jgi:hypothetical protein
MKTLLLLSLSLFSTWSFAGFSLVSKTDNSEVLELLNEATNTLPQKIKEDLNKEIDILFTHLDKSNDWKSPCLNNSTAQVYGKMANNKIYLHSNFIPKIKHNTSFECGHRSWKRHALATLIHELIHLWETTQDQMPSQGRHYTALVHGKWNLIKINGLKNKRTDRLPDSYELKNTQEHFAVNAEYFFLDASYACRRPQLALFFSNLFEVSLKECTTSRKVRVFDREGSINFDFSTNNVREIHYLLAGKGTSSASRYGHAMFRLVTGDSRKDIVVGFAAQINDTTINSINGLTGKYPSRLSMTPFTRTLENYNKGEFREMTSFPLGLNPTEIKAFLDQVLTLHWEYAGKYYFLSNNCADEALALLKSVINENDFLKEKVITPIGLVKVLQKHNLFMDQEPEYFPSHWETLRKIFDKFSGFTNITSLEKWWKLTAHQRAAIFESAPLKKSFLFAALSLEMSRARFQARQLENRIARKLQALTEEDEIRLSAIRMIEIQNVLLYGEKLEHGYGIPMKADYTNALYEVDTLESEFEKLGKRLADWGEKSGFSEIKELEITAKNQQWIREAIKAAP